MAMTIEQDLELPMLSQAASTSEKAAAEPASRSVALDLRLVVQTTLFYVNARESPLPHVISVGCAGSMIGNIGKVLFVFNGPRMCCTSFRVCDLSQHHFPVYSHNSWC